jgi:nicotinamidase/pyrazinamidase
MNINKTDALIIIDPQNDFCPFGQLAVEGGDQIMTAITSLSLEFSKAGAIIVTTQDWHPSEHKSFASNHTGVAAFENVQMPYGDQTLWPDHCVQGTYGADFHPMVKRAVERSHLIIRKGYNPEVDSYSAFYENDDTTATGLTGFLKDKGITRCVFVGLAYDFCVGFSALDAVKDGFEALVMKDLTRSIGMPSNATTTDKLMDFDLKAIGVQVLEGTVA